MSENIEKKDELENADTPSVKNGKSKKKSVGREIFEWVYSIVIAIVVAMLIKGFLFDVVRVDGKSMYPTLFHNDRLIVTKLGYEPKQGDIVILDSNYNNREEYFSKLAKSEGKDDLSDISKFFKTISLQMSHNENLEKVYYVKRVIATEGQTVDIRDGKVYVDDKQLDETYLDWIVDNTEYTDSHYTGETHELNPGVQFPFTVDEGCVFVMGDNRDHSLDSRSSRLGEVKTEAVLGKAQLRVYPFNLMGKVK